MLMGCSVPTHTWQGVDRELLWSSMITSAKTPDYSSDDPRKRWIVTENKVAIDRRQGRIDVNRKLSRSLKLPRQNEQLDKRHWFFVIQLLPIDKKNQDSSVVMFEVPDTQFVPARVHDEANRYFEQVDELLQAK
jgi:hypothetical protein